MHDDTTQMNTQSAHAALRELLPEYATFQALGTTPEPRFSELLAHLQTCDECSAELDELLALTVAAFTAQFEPAPVYPLPDLAFLPQPAPAPVASRPGVAERVGQVVVAFTSELLASLQQPSLAGALRGQLLYRYTQGGGPQNVDVTIEVFAEDAARGKGRVQVMVDVPTRSPLDQSGSHVTLRADESAWDGATDETGCISFAGVPLQVLPHLRVEIVPKVG